MNQKCDISVINDVKITKDGDTTHFTIDITDKQPNAKPTIFDKIKNWFRKSNVRPYIESRDFNNQGNDEMRMEDNEPIKGIEVGIRGEF